MTTDTPPDVRCPRCGGPLLTERMESGPHFARTRCRACGFRRWERAPMTPERAAAFVLPFGRHRGRTLAEVGVADRGYLEWLAALPALAPSIRQAVVCHLESAP